MQSEGIAIDNKVQSPYGTGYIPELVGMQVRNMWAFLTAQQQMLDGLSMLARQQSQITESSLRRALGIAKDAASSPSDFRGLIGARIDDLKSSILDAQANSNAISEIMVRSVGEVASTLQARMMAALDEFKALLEQAVPDGVPMTLPARPASWW